MVVCQEYITDTNTILTQRNVHFIANFDVGNNTDPWSFMFTQSILSCLQRICIFGYSVTLTGVGSYNDGSPSPDATFVLQITLGVEHAA